MGYNVAIDGPAGAGKSTIGIVLAKIIGYTFIDSDIIIQNEKNIIINMYNSNFVDKGSEDANKSYLRSVFNSAK